MDVVDVVLILLASVAVGALAMPVYYVQMDVPGFYLSLRNGALTGVGACIAMLLSVWLASVYHPAWAESDTASLLVASGCAFAIAVVSALTCRILRETNLVLVVAPMSSAVFATVALMH